MGTDLRRLVSDGAPAGNIYGVDLSNHWDLGYSLFRDRETFDVKFMEADLLRVEDEMELGALKGKIDVIHVTHVLHQWDWDTQVRASKNLAALSSPEPGSIIIGFQCGTTDIEERTRINLEEGKDTWTVHSPETFRKMWEIVEKETATKWECEAEMCEWSVLGFEKSETAYLGDDVGLLRFEVRRIE